VAPALEAVFASAGLAICGLALIHDLIEAKQLSLPFPVSMGAWSEHVFQARFRADALARPQVRRFRDWVRAEGSVTEAWMLRKAGSGNAKAN
jgi:LysR family glycine cleavage system transcriptional activator